MSESTALVIISILGTFTISLIIYIFCSWKRESVLSAKNKSLDIESAAADKETDKLKNEIIKLKEQNTKLKSTINEKFSSKAILFCLRRNRTFSPNE